MGPLLQVWWWASQPQGLHKAHGELNTSAVNTSVYQNRGLHQNQNQN